MHRILIVEDESIIRMALRKLLERHDYHVSEAESVQEATRSYDITHFDLIISDLVMPNIDGLEFYKTVQKNKPSIKFLMITSFPNDENAKEAKKLFKDNYLEKTANLEHLTKKVTELLKV